MPKVSPELALAMKEAYDAVSPFIELHTSRVCPTCRKVCCIDRHGTHEAEDLAFLDGLCEPPPPEQPLSEDTLPCRQLGELGCALKRWQRPYRCTWFFCQALLDTMPAEDPKGYRDFIKKLQRLQALRNEVWRLCNNQ